MKERRVHLVAAVMFFCAAAAHGQANAPMVSASPAAPVIDTSDCQALSAGDPHGTRLTAVCEFARTFLLRLPDFICEQTTISGEWPATVLKEEVKSEKGREVYTNPFVGGKRAGEDASSAVRGMAFKSSGELGTDLVSLFKRPIVAEFQFRKEASLRKTPVSVYGFHLSVEKNTFLGLRDNRGMSLFPEYEGELWLDSGGRLLRLELRSLHMHRDFGWSSVAVTIDYSEVAIGGLDTFLLPLRSETNVCNRRNSVCRKNIVIFDSCRKFATKSRILTDEPQP